MRHFIEVTLKVVKYYYNNKYNQIGNFSYYYCTNYDGWYKHRMYRGRFAYSKRPHFEYRSGYKEWAYNGNLYSSYEAYMMAVMK